MGLVAVLVVIDVIVLTAWEIVDPITLVEKQGIEQVTLKNCSSNPELTLKTPYVPSSITELHQRSV